MLTPKRSDAFWPEPPIPIVPNEPVASVTATHRLLETSVPVMPVAVASPSLRMRTLSPAPPGSTPRVTKVNSAATTWSWTNERH
jgi:hypothetical protein